MSGELVSSAPIVTLLMAQPAATTQVAFQSAPVNYLQFGDGPPTRFVELPCANPAPIADTAVAANSWGQVLALTSGATGALVNIVSSAPGYQVKGFIANGLGDGYFFLQVALVTVLSGRTRWTLPGISLLLPNGISIPTGSTVTLKVTNESGSTADFEATLLGS